MQNSHHEFQHGLLLFQVGTLWVFRLNSCAVTVQNSKDWSNRIRTLCKVCSHTSSNSNNTACTGQNHIGLNESFSWDVTLAISFPPYQKSKAQLAVERLWDKASPIQANHDCLMLSRRRPSWAFPSIWKILSWEEKAVTALRLVTASAASLLLSSWALMAFWDMFCSTRLV